MRLQSFQRGKIVEKNVLITSSYLPWIFLKNSLIPPLRIHFNLRPQYYTHFDLHESCRRRFLKMLILSSLKKIGPTYAIYLTDSVMTQVNCTRGAYVRLGEGKANILINYAIFWVLTDNGRWDSKFSQLFKKHFVKSFLIYRQKLFNFNALNNFPSWTKFIMKEKHGGKEQ